MIEALGLTKIYGACTAVDDLSFRVRPGLVTGFLGPNGAGKSTTMRMLLGLDRPTGGSSTINGRHYHQLEYPLREVGALLDTRSAHLGRSARNHLRILAASNGISFGRVDEVLGIADMEQVADKRVKTFSLGMNQRFGLAVALLGDPHTLLLDEPLNGLDVAGIHWVRNLLRGLAAEGRTVLVSSHLMSEVEGTAEHLVVIGRGRLIADMKTRHFINSTTESRVRVETPHADALSAVLEVAGGQVERRAVNVLSVSLLSRREIGELAVKNLLSLHGLQDESISLEEAFMKTTGASVEYHGKEY
jgi:ABC-2 type transport system ATP-binding protein